ncbi:hypothetical protein A2U01_0069968, partial [Trifolium medium]|nr:hypothetical protein [Trifolium medium]
LPLFVGVDLLLAVTSGVQTEATMHDLFAGVPAAASLISGWRSWKREQLNETT